MCGITAYFGGGNGSEIVLESLKRLEYRGYDSAGIATLSNSKIQIKKDTGEIDDIDGRLDLKEMPGSVAMGHTRWATHGGVTKENSHPHVSCDSRFAVVHNGIIENWESMKKDLAGHHFRSETDTEVIAHYIEEKSRDMSVEKAIQKFMKDAIGSFAVVLIDSEDETMYAFKRGSPLVLGDGVQEVFLGSDLYAFSPYTDEAVFFDDDEYAIVDDNGYELKDINGTNIERELERFDWNQELSLKENYDHYMRKEIDEIPKAISRLESSLKVDQEANFHQFLEALKNHDQIVFTASGTSYHASLLGVFYLQKAGTDAQTIIASEFQNYERVDEETLVVAISQSGETKDVLDSIEYSKERGADIASIVNVPYSSVERISGISIEIKAGQEICVASTKAFTNQVFLLQQLARKLGTRDGISGLPREIREVIEANESMIKEFARELKGERDIYVIGRGETYPIAREVALKLKEISYIHAEGMMGGELKHGTLALIEEGTPVISLIPERDSDIISNVNEVISRGARSIEISPWRGPFEFPSSNGKFPFFTVIIGFLLSYWLAREKDLPVDKPRNLAKSVTVK